MSKQPEPAWITAIKRMDVSIYDSLQIKIDGYNVSFSQILFKRKIVIVWYIDGVWKGEYIKLDSEIGAKFGSPKVISYPRNQYKIDKLLNGKRFADDRKKKFGKRVCGYLNYWNSTKSLIAHLKKTCKEFEVVEPNKSPDL